MSKLGQRNSFAGETHATVVSLSHNELSSFKILANQIVLNALVHRQDSLLYYSSARAHGNRIGLYVFYPLHVSRYCAVIRGRVTNYEFSYTFHLLLIFREYNSLWYLRSSE